MNFFKVLFSVCTGTERFAELSRLPLWRSLLHLMLLATLLATMITALRFPDIDAVARKITATLHAEFGEIKVTSNGFVPSIRPQERRRVTVYPGTVVEYFPDTGFKDKDLRVDDFSNGVVWTPGIAVLWLKTGSGFMLLPLNYAPQALQEFGKVNFMPVTPAGIVAFVKDLGRPAGPFMYAGFHDFANTMERTVLLFSGFMEVLLIFGGAVLFTSVFTGFFSIGGGASMLGMRYRNMWTIGLYAGFPAMLVAAVVSGFELPYFDFSTVYLFGMLGYFFVIIGRIQRQRMDNAGKPERN